jgi:hypothetical protein
MTWLLNIPAPVGSKQGSSQKKPGSSGALAAGFMGIVSHALDPGRRSMAMDEVVPGVR